MAIQTKNGEGRDALGLLGEHVTHSLQFYRMVEETTQNLTSVERGARQLREDVGNHLDQVRENPDKICFSCNGEGQTLLEEAEQALEDYVGILRQKLQSAYDDPDLHGGHEDVVTSAYEQTIQALSEVHDLLIDLRWEVMEGEADRSDTIGPFENWEDFWAALKEEG